MATKSTSTKATATKSPRTRKAATAAPKTRTAASKKVATKRTVAAPKTPSVSPEQRYNMIQEAAYHLAERDGFRGDPTGYWLAAEKHISEELAK